jgi:hypothetical protein
MANSFMRLSEPGLAFLKCAFASPDFNTDPGKGIPDRFEGKVVSRKDVLTAATTFTAAKDTFILVAPTPGVAYWVAEVEPGTYPTDATTFTAVVYPGFNSMFGSTASARSANVSSFRYSSMNVGIYPTSNMMQYGGSITVWKAPIQLSTSQFPIGADDTATSQLVHALQGLESVQAVGSDNYSESFIKGVFSQSVCNEPEFEFNNIIEGVQTLPPQNVTLAQSGQPFAFSAGDVADAAIVGWGNMDTIIIRVSTAASAVNTAIVKTWACIEYRPNPNSAFYQFGHDSPPKDEYALEEYRRIAKQLPCAVEAAKNATMWERVKQIIKSGLSIASTVPGPIGMTAAGLQGLSGLFTNLGI